MPNKCKFCKKKSDGWDLCDDCRELSKQGKIVHTRLGWKKVLPGQTVVPDMVYLKKNSIMTTTELTFYHAINDALAQISWEDGFWESGLQLLPQVALSAVVERTDDYYQSELNRVFDFLVVDSYFKPLFAIEINDRSHEAANRKQRDRNIASICKEAGLVIITFYPGADPDEIHFTYHLKNALRKCVNVDREPYTYKVVGVRDQAIRRNQYPQNLEKRERNFSKENDDVLILLTIFFGWLGVQRFYVGRVASGLLYMCTLGLFGIGWIVDIILVFTGKLKRKPAKTN